MSLRMWLRALGTTFLRGMQFDDWRSLLEDNEFAISPRFFGRAVATTAIAMVNSTNQHVESDLISEVRPLVVAAPIFVLGHFRSGTTYLHNLLAIDQQFAFPNVYQVHFPNTFLTTEPWFSQPMSWLFPRSPRQVDNLEEDIQSPAEDEFATCNMCGLSPHLSFVFPRRADYYDHYATFRGVAPAELARWKAALRLFMQKLTWKYRRPLVMKSPSHTGRVRLLLELFPDARFVHIHRHPFAVFRSTRRSTEVMLRRGQLQDVSEEEIDSRIIERYQAMFAEFHEQRRLIPAGQFHELRYEDLVREPFTQLAATYEQLRIPGFAQVAPAIKAYTAAMHGYENNRFAELAGPTKSRLATAWERCFDEWRYDVGAFQGSRGG